ncbi:non-specific serine/threonine protein kinase [Malassezia yamatoensis]|uniref:Serine/threonine-protein kinase RIO2 n=1 Tax=Malassezia yamatoensis TaxID=253288 RepID=A0AAJ5YR52_9BASI|nr:non-specific serine/threonine protein kinase [Malassezia yamatoensis]
MRLDATDVRYITPEEFRVLTAVEMGSKNHEIVPTTLIAQISALRHAGISKLLSSLAKRRLVARVQNNAYDGFRLTYGGYDYLAVRALSKRKSIYSVGQRIGVGKESDIQLVANEEGQARVLKLHRLGRISFRKVKEKRDYMGNRKSASWMFMSRLAAEKEYEFMTVLHQHGFPVPTPIDQARHTVVMDFIDAYPLRQISSMPIDQVRKLYAALMALIVRLAKVGLIHGDFNEFNLLIREMDMDYHEDEHSGPDQEEQTETTDSDQEAPGVTIEQGKGFERVVLPNELGSSSEEDSNSDQDQDEYSDDEMIRFEDGVQLEPILIDFPQMVSIQHPDAEYYFDRDVDCVKRFFLRRFRFESDEYPIFQTTIESMNGSETRLDTLTKASGYNNQFNELSSHLEALRVTSDAEFNTDSENSQATSEFNADPEEEEQEDEGGENETRLVDSASGRHPLDSSSVAARVAVSQAQSTRHAQKHHGRKAQATKAGRRHGGGKGKHNPKRAVADSLTF